MQRLSVKEIGPKWVMSKRFCRLESGHRKKQHCEELSLGSFWVGKQTWDSSLCSSNWQIHVHQTQVILFSDLPQLIHKRIQSCHVSEKIGTSSVTLELWLRMFFSPAAQVALGDLPVCVMRYLLSWGLMWESWGAFIWINGQISELSFSYQPGTSWNSEDCNLGWFVEDTVAGRFYLSSNEIASCTNGPVVDRGPCHFLNLTGREMCQNPRAFLEPNNNS